MSSQELNTVLASLADLQERYLHQEETLQVLSDQIARQQRDIDLLNRKQALMLEQLKAVDSGVGVTVGDERPPHY